MFNVESQSAFILRSKTRQEYPMNSIQHCIECVSQCIKAKKNKRKN